MATVSGRGREFCRRRGLVELDGAGDETLRREL
jgi:hypothetical protein